MVQLQVNVLGEATWADRHGAGRAPECRRRWALRLLELLKRLWHI